ncbi:ATP-dependent DNA helicase RecG, partial [Candidatus Berkelbacteria bacterium]|nr:ATP-dependent DNA helicase RecG [Candidatus Berkelbacteria bacterium]
LPFFLTHDQKRSIWEIVKDLSRPAPMNRLLEGDVGSGKTVVAAAGVLLAAKSNFQSVWLAPTEVLANQHAQSVSKLLEPFGISVGLLTAATSKKAAEISQNQLIIGTHAILQKDIILPNLAFVIVDEQHRFGVKQRAWLRQPTTDNQQPTTTHPIPHFLSMTATPIPRTLALSIFGDLDISVLDELPPGRKKVETKIVPPLQRKAAYDFIRQQVKKGRQIFVICPLIEKKEDGKALNLFELDCKSAIAEYEKLSKEIFPDLRIGLLHGKMKSKEKEEVMGRFKNREIDILVSTAVIEVGIDIPNATVMMIEGAERFGLASLHQFRGRVGRGGHQSFCLVFPQVWGALIQKRLLAFQKINNGFELAEIDLKLRGPGELGGIRQSGIPDLKMASLSDIILLRETREAARESFPNLKDYPSLQNKLKEFIKMSHLE